MINHNREKSLGTNFNQDNWMLVIRLMYVVLGIYNFANFLGLLPFSEALLLSNGTSY